MIICHFASVHEFPRARLPFTAFFLRAEKPPEVYDPRSLFDRLESNRAQKEEEYAEAHKFSAYACLDIGLFG